MARLRWNGIAAELAPARGIRDFDHARSNLRAVDKHSHRIHHATATVSGLQRFLPASQSAAPSTRDESSAASPAGATSHF